MTIDPSHPGPERLASAVEAFLNADLTAEGSQQ